MVYLDYFNDDERVPPRPDRRAIIDRSNPLNEFDEINFRDRFRMYKQNVADIIILLEPRLSSHSLRGRPIPPSLQILITLRFLACGTFHRETGDLCGVSEPTVCKIVHQVCNAICKLKDDYIKFPDAATQAIYKVQFYEYGNFPGVIGCIDGCHTPIKRPSTPDAEEYRNHKNWFSINVQSVCTPTRQFSNIVAHWKGAIHDSRTFQNSSLYAHLEGGQHSGIILGDSGYAQNNFLFTPYLHAVTPEQQRYNQAHIRTRGIVEHMFGVW
ncbi:putative nuclease HARBI1 [Tachysurus vachellii]|uniref:putative nuclease HARBI1 n=1 Tax=Tachysurus vachellii TaxID=175792 RepID=UPI00296B5344|nr:putative nuclease HARBI1 [Tachysurus vachellii]